MKLPERRSATGFAIARWSSRCIRMIGLSRSVGAGRTGAACVLFAGAASVGLATVPATPAMAPAAPETIGAHATAMRKRLEKSDVDDRARRLAPPTPEPPEPSWAEKKRLAVETASRHRTIPHQRPERRYAESVSVDHAG